AALDDASILIRAAGGKDYVGDNDELVDVPDVVTMVTLRAALRSFTNPTGVTQETAGPFTASFANSSTDVYLTTAEKALVRQAGGKTVMSTITTTRGCIETGPIACGGYAVADEYLAVDPPGDPIPFL
ncbi:MAG: hypothetical protein Q8K63_06230, partial [Acidimicrobiales bacterium]|nr:hypothetical protein [Acidimicrobiales bacterium]